MLLLKRSHREDNSLHALEGIIIYIHILKSLTHTRNHRGKVLNVTHLLNLLNLVVEILKRELVLSQLLMQLLGLLLVKLLLSLLHKGNNVTHTQNSVCNTLRVEEIQRLHLLTGAHKLNRLVNHRLNRERSTAAGITIQLGKNNAVKIQPLIKGLGCLHSILTGHRVNNKESLRRLNGLLNGSNLLHHLLINRKTAGSIHNNKRIALSLSKRNSILSNLNRILITLLGIDSNTNLAAQHLQLVNSGRTINVARHKENLKTALALAIKRKLAGEGSLTGALQSRYQNNARIALNINIGGGAAHKSRQLVVDNLNHHLPRLDRLEHIHTQSLLLHRVAETLCKLITYIRIQQRLANILKSLRNINLRNPSFTFEQLKGVLQPVYKILEHTTNS